MEELEDERIVWLVKQVLSYLEFPNENRYIEDFLLNKTEDNDVIVLSFLNDPVPETEDIVDADRAMLIFYKTIEEFEEEVEIPISRASLTDETESQVSRSVSESDTQSITSIRSESRVGSLSLEEEDEEEVPEVEKSTIKKITQIVIRPVLHLLKENGNFDQPLLYVFRITSDAVPECLVPGGAEAIMPQRLEFIYMNSEDLTFIQHIIEFFPKMIQKGTGSIFQVAGGQDNVIAVKDKVMPSEIKLKYSKAKIESRTFTNQLSEDLQLNFEKFTNSITRVLHQIEGNIRLEIPEVSMTESVVDVAKNPDLIAEFQSACVAWCTQLTMCIEQQQIKVPDGKGPLAELDYWRERYAGFNTMLEQLQHPLIQKVIRVLEISNGNNFQEFQARYLELNRFCLEAKDNVRFLNTLERQFKNMVYGTSLQSIIDLIPSLLNSLRMVWIISRHYNRDERFVPLMERIAWQLEDKILKTIDIRTFFTKNKPATVKKILLQARKLMEVWRESYFETRAIIESGGLDARWEFDKQKLFFRTDYIATISTDLNEISDIQAEFLSIFGPQLRSVLGDPRRIDQVLERVSRMVEYIQNVEFPLFDPSTATKWKECMEWFKQEETNIEMEAISIIDESFKNLRSAEGGLELLINFQKTNFRDSINSQLMKKFTNVLSQYTKELEIIDKIFKRDQHNPPVFKSYPPMSGTIFWERNLFHKIKRPMLRFLQVDQLSNSDLLPVVKSRYLGIGRLMKDYEDKKIRFWLLDVNQNLETYLKKTVISPLKSSTKIQTAARSFTVTFNVWLILAIKEARYMEALGVEIPEIVRNIALREESYVIYIQSLKIMLARYDAVLANLEPVEVNILQVYIKELEASIHTGTQRLNWSSLGISDFIYKGNQSINKFSTMVNQLKKYNSDIHERVFSMMATCFFRAKDFSSNQNEVMSCKKFFRILDQRRERETEFLISKYKSIPPIMLQVEALILQTNSGKAQAFQTFYTYWERRIYNALIKMFSWNLQLFNNFLLGDNPIFEVKLNFVAPDIVFQPSTEDIMKLIMSSMTECLESSKSLIRWLHGSCIETPIQKVGNESRIYSFYMDVSRNKLVTDLLTSVHANLSRLINQMFLISQKWRRYRSLWIYDKEQTCSKWLAKKPNVVHFDEKLLSYKKIMEETNVGPYTHQLGGIILNYEMLNNTIQTFAKQWMLHIGNILHTNAFEEVTDLHRLLQTMATDIQKRPVTMEDFKLVLETITYIREQSLEIEFKIMTIEESYRTLLMHQLEVEQFELDLVVNCKEEWEALTLEAKKVDAKLTPVKQRFADVTEAQVDNLQQDITTGTVGDDLDKGQLQLQFESEFQYMFTH